MPRRTGTSTALVAGSPSLPSRQASESRIPASRLSLAALQPVEHHPSPEAVSADYPLQLITGRSLYQFNAGTMTGQTPNNELRSSDLLEISPFDAREAGFGDGDRARVVSRYGSAVLPVHVNAAMARGQLFATLRPSRSFRASSIVITFSLLLFQ